MICDFHTTYSFLFTMAAQRCASSGVGYRGKCELSLDMCVCVRVYVQAWNQTNWKPNCSKETRESSPNQPFFGGSFKEKIG